MYIHMCITASQCPQENKWYKEASNEQKSKVQRQKIKLHLKQVFENLICVCIYTLQLHNVYKPLSDIGAQMNKSTKCHQI